LATSSSPYCVVRLGDEIQKTAVATSKGPDPVWDPEVVELPWDAQDTLEITLREQDSGVFREDRKVGVAHVNVSALARKVRYAGPLKVYRNGAEETGALMVDIASKELSALNPTMLLQPVLVKVHSNGLMGAVAALADYEALDLFKTYRIVLQQTGARFGDRVNANHDEEHKKLFRDPLRKVVQAEHASLYSDWAYPHLTFWGGKRYEKVTLSTGNDFLSLVGNGVRKGRRRVFTYVLLDEGMFFSETGANIAKDFFSKHAVHANASPGVRMAGTFRVCETPQRQPVVVIDNDSGTYRPRSEDLVILKELLEFNFPGIVVCVMPCTEPQLEDAKAFYGPNESKGEKGCVYSGQWKWQVESEEELQAASIEAPHSVWEWKNRSGWQRYAPEDEALLCRLQAESRGQAVETSKFSFGHGNYLLDFTEGFQTNQRTGRVREIRQILSGSYVPAWEISEGGVQWKACSFHDAIKIEEAYLATPLTAILTLNGVEHVFDFKVMTCASTESGEYRSIRRLASSGV